MLNGKWKYENLWVNPWQIISRCYFLACVHSFWKLLNLLNEYEMQQFGGRGTSFHLSGIIRPNAAGWKIPFLDVSTGKNIYKWRLFCMLWLKKTRICFFYMNSSIFSWICLRGPQKIKNIHYRFPPNGGFPIGKINNHLKQNPVLLFNLLPFGNKKPRFVNVLQNAAPRLRACSTHRSAACSECGWLFNSLQQVDIPSGYD